MAKDETQRTEVLARALAFVAEFDGDGRCALNCLHAEALADEITRLRTDLAEATRERDVERNYRIAIEDGLKKALDHVAAMRAEK